MNQFNHNSFRETEAISDMLKKTRDLVPLIRENSAKAEEARRVPESVIEALTAAGTFRTSVPKRYGGLEASMKTMLDVSSIVGEGDGGTSWVVTLCNGCAWLAGLYPVAAQDDVWGNNPDARVSGVLTPSAEAKKVAGGYEVSGKWFYNSGSWHADWAVLGFPVVNEAGEAVDQGLALIPRSDLEIEETWFVAGMAASASNCLVAKNAFVPEHRVLSVPTALGDEYPSEVTDNEPFYRSAFVPLLCMILAGPQLGMGRAALDFVISKAATRPIAYTFFNAQADSTAFQMQIAEAATRIDTAHLHAYRAAADIDNAAINGIKLDLIARTRVRNDAGVVIENITRAIDTLMFAHGAGGFANVSPLQRLWRDSAVAARHSVTLPIISSEIYGKALLGVKEQITPLI